MKSEKSLSLFFLSNRGSSQGLLYRQAESFAPLSQPKRELSEAYHDLNANLNIQAHGAGKERLSWGTLPSKPSFLRKLENNRLIFHPRM